MRMAVINVAILTPEGAVSAVTPFVLAPIMAFAPPGLIAICRAIIRLITIRNNRLLIGLRDVGRGPIIAWLGKGGLI